MGVPLKRAMIRLRNEETRTIGMLASGLWDWAAGHPTRIRWHALTGVGLAVYLLVHTLRRRARMRRSLIR